MLKKHNRSLQKFLIELSIVAVVVFGGYKGTALSASQSDGAISTIVRNEGTILTTINSVIRLSTILLSGLIWLGIVMFLRLKKQKDIIYLLFFTIFYVYLIKVLDITLFQFQTLILLKQFVPNLILQGQPAGQTMNLIPLITLTPEELRTSLLNILLLVPFGFGLPFITNLRFKKIVVAGALFSLAIELLQLVTGFMGKITFRIADINDVVFNTVGVAVGYILFVGFVRTYARVSHNWKMSANPILRYIVRRPQI
jgi:glycopeptide antibiotics resistance protein